LGLGAIGLFLAQELNSAHHKVSGLDFRTSGAVKKLRIMSEINHQKTLFDLNINSQLSLNDEIIIVALKSYALNDLLISRLIEGPAELLFLQNGLLIKSKLQNRSSRIAIGTILGIQATLQNETLRVTVENSKIAVESQQGCRKIKELALENKLPHSIIDNKPTVNIMIYEKFVRWVITSCLNLTYDASLGDCLAKISPEELKVGISELAIFVDRNFDVKVDQTKILEALYKLPKALKTSSYIDIKKGSPAEIIFELENVIAYFANINIECVVLSKWRQEILNDK
jgi:ketopantoate reductase